MTNMVPWGKQRPAARATAPRSYAGAQWIAQRLRQKSQNLTHDLKHLLQLVAIEASQWMEPGAGKCPLAPAQTPRPWLDHR
jgi:hypothetical protein